MLIKTGIPTPEQIEKVMPSKKRLAQGPVAVIECFQSIPCNPCATSCPTGAILPFNNINDLPEFDENKCTGCGICVSSCPGLAIFIVDETYSESEALIRIPYEYLPVPEAGSVVDATDRAGQIVCKGKVVKIFTSRTQDKTTVLSIAVPKEYSMAVRGIKMPKKAEADDTCICRCEEISLTELREAIKQGYTDFNEIKRKLRVGMGPCQGRTCRPLILREIAMATGQPMEDIEPTTFRPPTKPIKISVIAGDGNEE